MKGPRVLRLLIAPVLLAGFAFATAVVAETVPLAGAAYIEDVPFVGFGEAAACDYPSKDVMNPAVPAALEMVYRYWGVYCLPHGCDEDATANFEPGERISGGSPEDLKALVDARVPAVVFLATTPYAHRAYVILTMTSYVRLGEDHKVAQTHPTSGCLYPMASLDSVNYAVEHDCKSGVNDSVINVPRVVVGYDDIEGVFIVHDPSLGPGLAIPYSDFDAMWRISENQYSVIRPVDWQDQIDAIERTPPRARTVDDDAAVALFYGTALAATGRYAEAEAMFNEALESPGISAAREHLIRLELAVVMAETGRLKAAIRQVKKANNAFGGHAEAWRLLAAMQYNKKQDNTMALYNYYRLCNTRDQEKAAHVLAQDFYILGCKMSHVASPELARRLEFLGWGIGPAFSARQPADPNADELEY